MPALVGSTNQEKALEGAPSHAPARKTSRVASSGVATSGGLALAVFVTSVVLLAGGREPPGNSPDKSWNLAAHWMAGDVSAPADARAARSPSDSEAPEPSAFRHTPLLNAVPYVPAAALVRGAAAVWPAGADLFAAFVARVVPAVMAGLLAWLFLRLSLRIGLPRKMATLGSLIMVCASIVWVYARLPWAPILHATLFTGFVSAMLQASRGAKPGALRACVWWFAALVCAFPLALLMLPGAAGFVVWARHKKGVPWPPGKRLALQTLIPAAVLFGLLLLDSFARAGSLQFWRFLFPGPFNQSLLMGTWAMATAPGRAPWIFTPLLLVSALGFVFLRQPLQREIRWIVPLTLGPVLVALAKASLWPGGWAWGARHLVFVTPVLLLPAVVWFDRLRALSRRERAPRVLFGGALLATSLYVQILGSGIHPDVYQRVSHDIKIQWLAAANQSAPLAPPPCHECFEQSHVLSWLTPLTPLSGHSWLLWHLARGADWEEAEQNGPWHRHTVLKLPIFGQYAFARIDWWYLAALDVAPVLGTALLILLALGTAAAFRWWWRAEFACHEVLEGER